ncbi:MAG: amidohydrolase family protein, partial [Gammaproteobacteria bacterium]|nr:amidohydrolase family protein [Gammaproteobacteria bacterium]
MHDLVIKNARIADGLGNPIFEADVAVDDGRVSEIGQISTPAKETVDAQGMVLAPGVIDVHTHYDAQLLWDPTASPSPALGVTTVVIGNCGFGIVPAPEPLRERILADLAEVEGMPLNSLQKGVNWNFETFAEYLNTLRTQGVYPNVAALASHSTIRSVVMGDDSAQRNATPEELEQMLALFRDAMDAGAVGLGSSTNENHRGRGGVPISSRLAEDEEFSAFARTLGEYQHGVFMITTGNHMDMRFMEDFAATSGRPSLYAAHFHYPQQPARGRKLMEDAEAARKRGNPVFTQGSCQPLSLGFTLDQAYILKMIDGWPATEDHRELRAIFSDSSFRDRLRTTLATPDDARVFNGRWEWVIVTRTG